ncbi:hypothetical protein ACQEVZ_17770 [Dactylosporangium sp. CA-152071]|uniref:hypothetical protein n=1 Tax=Dactylosporangium sp. CA-152071 TaxID=3239933 RepID=UPI003D8C7FDA
MTPVQLGRMTTCRSHFSTRCGTVKDAAAVIDARWPVEKRANTWMRDKDSYNPELPPF